MLTTNDLSLLHETKKFLYKNLEIKDMGETFYVIKIEIFYDKSPKLLGLSQKAYINKVLKRFKMKKCYVSVVPIQNRDKFNLMQCPRNELEHMEKKMISYAFVVGSLMYA